MENETRRIVVAMLVAMAVFVAYQFVINKVLPPRPPAPPPAAAPTAPAAPTTATGPTTAERPATAAASHVYSLVSGDDIAPLTLGGQAGDALRIGLTPRGAAMTTLELTARLPNGRYVHRTKPHEDAPYQLISTVFDGQRDRASFETHRLRVGEQGDQAYEFGGLPWKAEEHGEQVVFATALRTDDGADLLRITKTYTLHHGQPIFDLELAVENLSPEPLTIRVEQDGPLGIRQENPQYDMRRLLTAQKNGSSVELDRARQWSDLQKATLDPATGSLPLLRTEKGPFVWTALVNKYFGVFTRSLPSGGEPADFVLGVNGMVVDPQAVVAPNDLLTHGDLLARVLTKPVQVAAGARVRFPLEVYVGPKDSEHLRQVNPDFVDTSKLYYQLAQSADGRCFCSFLWLEEIMLWLMDKIHFVVRNYGVAIIILVIIIRGILHPLSVFQQKSTFRMQESMGKIQPKIQALKEKYPNDKVKQNQEMMKLFGEEGVNPASNFIPFLPIMIQMPILVALWTALNTDVHLRHAPFDGWWIIDLSSPDSFLSFNPPITVPILGQLPLIGGIFTGVASLNLLPILMGVSMWLQQKYMPKPQHAKTPKPAGSKPASGMSPEDQARQAQIMAYVMAILFPLMFYKMPSGLNLYWLSTNVFGIAESIIIRRQIEEERRRRQTAGPPPPARPGLVGRLFKHLASQAEGLQRKADEIANVNEPKKKPPKKEP
jgi:YidC/Oxa1 family membrane protein insertase